LIARACSEDAKALRAQCDLRPHGR